MKMSCKAIIICIQSFCNIKFFFRLYSPRLQQLSTLLESKELFSDSTTRSLSLSQHQRDAASLLTGHQRARVPSDPQDRKKKSAA